MWFWNVAVWAQGLLGIAVAAGWIATRETRALRRAKLMAEVLDVLPNGAAKDSLATELEQTVASIANPAPAVPSSEAEERDTNLFWTAIGVAVLGFVLDLGGGAVALTSDVSDTKWVVSMMVVLGGIALMFSGLGWATTIGHRIQLRRAVVKSIEDRDARQDPNQT